MIDPLVRPVDIPALRGEIVEMLRSDRYREQNESVPYRHPALPRHQALEREAQLFASAELFSATADMTELAAQAGRSLPEFGYAPEDLPAKAGLILFDRTLAQVPHGEPPIEYSIDGYFWAEVAGRGILCQPLTSRDAMLQSLVAAGIATTNDADYSRGLMPLVIPMAHRSSWLPYGAVASDEETRVLTDGIKGLRAMWLLMQQPVSTTTGVTLDRVTRRRLARTGAKAADVRVINLRRHPGAGQGGGTSERDYHHQWIVRGHWRQQWYPAREVHRPVWIAPHIKGPEGAPMLGGEKVYVAKADPPAERPGVRPA